jgi:hypothetical protein
MYNLFLDDVRDANKFLSDLRAWETVRNYNEFVRIIQQRGLPQFISFDHDLDWEHYPMNNAKSGSVVLDYDSYKEKTGMDCAKWLIEYCMRTKQLLPEFQVHSMNPIGKLNILSLLNSYKKSEQETDYE